MAKAARITKRTFLCFLAYFVSVVVTVTLGENLWPEGLLDNSHLIFWFPSGVLLFLLTSWGPAYAPVVFLAVIPAVLMVGEPWDRALVGAIGNCFEILLGWWILVRIGRFDGHLNQVRVVVALAVASLLGGLVTALSYPIWQMLTGELLLADWGRLARVIVLSNACGTFLVVSLLSAICGRSWVLQRQIKEALALLLILILACSLAFNGVFNDQKNFAFLIFPLVIYISIRFGPSETAVALGIVAIGIYLTFSHQGSQLTGGEALSTVHFLQAFTWVLASTGLCVAALISEQRQADRRILEEKARVMEADLREERARLDALRFQMNPHFMFNALNSIYAALPNDAGTPRRMLAELSAYLRTVVDQPGGTMYPLREEIASLRKYLAIEQQRYGADLNVRVQVEQDVEQTPVPDFLLQPLLENAIRHGFQQNKGRLEILLKAWRQSDVIHIEVTNTGAWTEHNKRKGVGLKNIRRRLELVYQDKAALVTGTRDGCAYVRIDLPWEAEDVLP